MEGESRDQQLLSIRKHNGACANPTGFVKDLQDLVQKKWNKEKDGQVCASVIEDGKRHLMSYDGERFATIDISDVPNTDLVNAASQEETFDRVQAKLDVFKHKFAHGKMNQVSFQQFDPDLYKLNFVRQGEQVVVPAQPDTIVACILAAMHPTYYDFNIYDHKYKENVNYSTPKGKNIFEHSGDVVQDNTLLHFAKLKGNKNMDHKMALFITGYLNTPLEKFDSQSPANLLFDHEKKIIHIIEFPLDKATVGDATLGIPGVGEVKNGYLYFDVFTKPETGSGSAPSYETHTLQILNSAVERFSSCKERAAVDLLEPISHPISVRKNEQSGPTEEQEMGPHILQIEVGNVKRLALQSSHLIKTMGGVSCYLNGELDKRVHTVPPCDLGNIVLPGVLGPIEGPFICLAAHSIDGSGSSPHELGYFKNCFPIIIVSTEMTDAARQTAGNNRINGLFIIEPEGPVDTLEKLAMVNKNAVTALAGPMSLVLVKHGDAFRYLEGIALEGLVNEVPEFGDFLHLEIETIQQWALKHSMDEPVVDITKCTPKIKDKSFTLPEILSLIETLSIDEILDMKQSILCLYYQLTRIYDDEELQTFAKELFNVLDRVLTAPPKNTEELRKLQEDFKNGETKMKVSPIYQKTKEEYAKKKKQLRFLMDKVSSLLSEKNSSSKSMTHKQLKRFNAIKSNVDKINKMGREEFEEIVEMSCSEMGVLVCAGEPSELKNFIDTIGKNKMKERLISDTKKNLLLIQRKICEQHQWDPRDEFREEIEQCMHCNKKEDDLAVSPSIITNPVMQLSFRQQMIDALTATCLLQITSGSGPLHSQDNSITLAMPESNESSKGAVLIPLLDMFVQMSNPYKGNWINLCNDPDVAMFRLLMRRTFIKASVGRELPQRIEPTSKDLGWGMVTIYLDIMHQLSSHRHTAMTEQHFDETLCQQIRCLFGLMLTQLAAGQDPISLIWQLWRGENSRPELPIHSWQWPLYLEMAYLMQFTGWSQAVFKRNLKILLIRALNSKIAYPMCKFLRAEKVDIKKNKYGPEYQKKLQKIYYPAKMSLTKKTLALLENREIPSKEFLEENENIFRQFPNRSFLRRGGIRSILIQIALWIKHGDQYRETSKQFLFTLCTSTVKKYEPILKICRENLKSTLKKALAEKKAPNEDQMMNLTKAVKEVSATFDHEKNVGFSLVFKEMKKVLKLLVDWSSAKDNGEGKNITEKGEKVAKELCENMYIAVKHGCWNIDEDDHNPDAEIETFTFNLEKNIQDDKNHIMERIFENKSNKHVKTILDPTQQSLERVTNLAKLIQIEDVAVLINLARFAGFGEYEEEIKENLCLVLRELFYCWETDPDVVEKLLADKIWTN